MNKRTQISLLRQCAILFALKKVCNQSSLFEWLKIVFHAHRCGFLYCGFAKDGSIDIATIAYRTPCPSPKTGDTLPFTEKGNYLYVCAVASKTKNSRKLFQLMRWYLREHSNVDYLFYHKRNTDEIKIHCLRNHNGKKEVTDSKSAKSA
jgi:hypothetical protein